jgi:hypothetical protein
MKHFEFSSKEIYNPQNYLDSACDNVDFHANVDEMPQQDYQHGYSDDDDDVEIDMNQQYDVEEFAGQNARRRESAALFEILGEMKSVVIEDDVEDDGDNNGEEDTQAGIEAFSFLGAAANKNWIGPEYWRPSRSQGKNGLIY